MSEDFIDILLNMYEPAFVDAEKTANPPPAPPYTIRSWGEIRTIQLPPRDTFFDQVFATACVQSIVGQGGVGKSRISLNLARNNVLEIPFCGLDTGKRKKWLFVGNENSVLRWQRDIIAMSQGLSPDQIALLNAHIFLHCLETPEDAHICLADESIKQKWQTTIAAINPDVLVGDPWGEIQFGDPNNDLDSRQSIRELIRICHHTNHKMAVVILHHARTGRSNIVQAAGWDKGNFGKGSKALYSGSRAQINIAPADPDDHSRLVMVCAKSNDAPPFKTRGVILDEETMTYDEDPSFDFDAWVNDVEGKRQPKSSKGSIMDVVDVISAGATDSLEIKKRLAEDHEMTVRTAERWIKKAFESGAIRKRKDGTYVLTGKFPPRKPVETDGIDDVI